ncbi:FecR family protein [Microvirga rosea]|nr:FecR domain-containing protein [Microvirga rosea]MCB8822536.1 FecR family protein [Microvirga rosea]
MTLPWLLLSASAYAQGVGCVVQTDSSRRQVLHCRDGLSITTEEGADFTVTDDNRDGRPDGAVLRRGAVLVDAPSPSVRRGFQILTPQAVAAVRGTQWAVDVDANKTAVFVVSGRVSVRRVQGARSVNLNPGEGVDVDTGTAPLTVRRWPAARAAALLARLGR